MIKKIAFFFVPLFLGIGLAVWVVRLIGWREITSAFLIFTGWHGVIILLLTCLMLFFGLWKWQIILKSQGHNVPLLKLGGLYLASFSLVYLFPMMLLGEEILKGYILKEKFSIPLKNGIASIFIDKILEITSFLITIFAGLIFFLFEIGFLPQKLGIALGVILFIFTAVIGFLYFKIWKKESVVKAVTKFFNHKRLLGTEILETEKEIFVFFKYRRSALLQASLLAFLRVAVTWLRCWLLILFLGKSLGFLPTLSILGFYYFAFLIPIPAALGSHEAIQTFVFSALGMSGGTAAAFAVILRGAELVFVLIGLAIFLKLGMGLLKTLLFKRIEILVEK